MKKKGKLTIKEIHSLDCRYIMHILQTHIYIYIYIYIFVFIYIYVFIFFVTLLVQDFG